MKRSKNLPDKQQADQGLIDFFTAEIIENLSLNLTICLKSIKKRRLLFEMEK
jgi:hypothetical protein